MAGENSLSSFRQSCQDSFGRESGGGQGHTYALAESIEALLFGQKNQPVTQTQNGKGGPRSQSKVLAKFFRNGELALFPDLGGGQILERILSICHVGLGRKILPQTSKSRNCFIVRRLLRG
jgi:hypothetical protein